MKLGVFTRAEKTNKSFAGCAAHMRALLTTAMMTLAYPGGGILMRMTTQLRGQRFIYQETEFVGIGIACRIHTLHQSSLGKLWRLSEMIGATSMAENPTGHS
jgi:hypothetical protein